MTEGSAPTSRFFDGIKFGLGFSIPFVLLYVGAGAVMKGTSDEISRAMFSAAIGKAYGPESGLQLLHHESKKRAGKLVITGRLRNAGNDTWEYVRLQVDLLDEDGQLVTLCPGRCAGILHPGQERSFAVECEGSTEDPLPAFKRYTIEIVDASYKEPPKTDDDGA